MIKNICQDIVIQLTSIDSASMPRDVINPCLKNDHIVKPTETFENLDFDDCQFDLIISIHSTYLMDTSYLTKMYALLAENGELIVVSSPYENNAINSLCGIIDRNISEIDTRIRWKPYEGKKVVEDPLRNFAEDLYEAAIQSFHKEAVHKVDMTSKIETSLFKDQDSSLTELAVSAIQLFSHNLLSSERLETVKEQFARHLDSIDDEGYIYNNNSIISVSKQDVKRHLGNDVNGKLFPAHS